MRPWRQTGLALLTVPVLMEWGVLLPFPWVLGVLFAVWTARWSAHGLGLDAFGLIYIGMTVGVFYVLSICQCTPGVNVSCRG